MRAPWPHPPPHPHRRPPRHPRRTALPLAAAAAATACAGHALLATPPAEPPPPEAIETTVFLIGDAGAPDPGGDRVLTALAAQVGRAAGEPLVVFLGDNVYPRGVPDSGAPERAEAERRLAAQTAVLAGGAGRARAVFLSGNHDWNRGADDGWDRVRNQEQLLARLAPPPAARWLPSGGCPGPAVLEVGARLRLVALDTQWWLHEGPRPESDCPAGTTGAATAALRAALAQAGGRHVIVAGHHPLASGGVHGGHFSWRQHVFPLRELRSWLWLPLPLVGSAYPLARMSGISPQDLSSGRNEAMRDSLAAAFAAGPPLVYAAGHEHALQVMDGPAGGKGPRHYVVSGGGYFGHTRRVVPVRGSRYAAARSGFVRLELLGDGRVRLVVVEVTAADAADAFTMWLDTEPAR
jgi:hypothetical protein